MDLSGSLQGAGGIGGLISVTDSTGTTFFATCDANGNMAEYIDSTGNIVAHYEYDPYGNTTVSAGAMVNQFAFRFSTKYLDAEISTVDGAGLYYYGYRYYNPTHGRWLSNDPLGEKGGLNVYAFCSNDSLGGIDLFGLEDSCAKQARDARAAARDEADIAERAARELRYALEDAENLGLDAKDLAAYQDKLRANYAMAEFARTGTATLTINTHGMIFSSSGSKTGWPHAWISISDENGVHSWGFYPGDDDDTNGFKQLWGATGGDFKEDDNKLATRSREFEIDAATAERLNSMIDILDETASNDEFDWGLCYNCADFTGFILDSAEIEHPSFNTLGFANPMVIACWLDPK